MFKCDRRCIVESYKVDPISRTVNGVVDVAASERDKATQDFLWGFVREQVEEEATASSIVEMIKRAGNSNLYFVDSKLGERQ